MRNAKQVLILMMLCITGCATTKGTPAEQRSAILDMRNTVLTDLYKEKGSARAEIAAAPGYGVFSNANINLLIASFGGGYGVIHDNRGGADTYMKMGEVGVGLGAGVKDYRIVFVFHDAATMTDFVEKGWSFGGQADAAAKAGEQGAAVGAEKILDGVTVYQLTESGLALQATVKGTKYWKDDELN
ncbi:MAG: YSC84-related protein [Woeseiaceae bacterium]